MVGSGFHDEALGLLNARRGVISVQRQNGYLSIALQKDTAMAPLTGFLVSSGAQIEEIRRGTISLEEVFMTLMERE